MSNRVVYILELQDKYSRVAEKINAANARIKTSMQKVQAQSIHTSATLRSSFANMQFSANEAALSISRSSTLISTKLHAVGASSMAAGKNMSLMATLPIALVGTSLIKSAMDAEEARQKFDVTFSTVIDKANAMRESLVTNYAQSRKGATEMLSGTGDMLTGFGFSADAALDLSMKVQQLAIDLGSFANVDAERASSALTKGLLGERESMKLLGIAILEEDVKAKVASMAATGELSGMTMRQAKAYATLALASEQSKNAIGDKQRSMASAANQTVKMQNKLDDLSVTLGTKLLPLQLKITEAVISFVDWMEALSGPTQKAILMFVGFIAVVGPLLILLGVLSTAFGYIAAGLSLVASAAALATGAMAVFTLPILLVVGAIVAVIAIAWLLYSNWETIWTAIGGWIDWALAKWDLFAEKVAAAGGWVAAQLGFGDSNITTTSKVEQSNNSVAGGAGTKDEVVVTVKAEQGTTVTGAKGGRSGRSNRLKVGVNNQAN